MSQSFIKPSVKYNLSKLVLLKLSKSNATCEIVWLYKSNPHKLILLSNPITGFLWAGSSDAHLRPKRFNCKLPKTFSIEPAKDKFEIPGYEPPPQLTWDKTIAEKFVLNKSKETPIEAPFTESDKILCSINSVFPQVIALFPARI